MRTFLFITPEGQTTQDEPASLEGYKLYLHPKLDNVLVFIHSSQSRRGFRNYNGQGIQVESLTQWLYCMKYLNPDLHFSLPTFMPEIANRCVRGLTFNQESFMNGKMDGHNLTIHGDRTFRYNGFWVVFTTHRAFLKQMLVHKINYFSGFCDPIEASRLLNITVEEAERIKNGTEEVLLYQPDKRVPCFYSAYDAYRWLRNNKPSGLLFRDKTNYFDVANFLYQHCRNNRVVLDKKRRYLYSSRGDFMVKNYYRL